MKARINLHLDITLSDQGIIQMIAMSSKSKGFSVSFSGVPHSELLLWLEQYEQGKEPQSSPSLSLSSLPIFSQKVLKEVQNIPFGKTASYGAIARAIGHPRAARAVGNACRSNPCPLVIPCHRVIHTNGRKGDFAYGAELKVQLIQYEQRALYIGSRKRISCLDSSCRVSL